MSDTKDERREDHRGAEVEGEPGSSEARRRLIKGLVASAPVVASVASRPVLAARSCTESGQLSGNTSGTQVICAGEGCSPGFWKNHTDLWHPNYPSNAVFNTLFSVNVFGSNVSLFDVISSSMSGNTGPAVNVGVICTNHNLVRQLARCAVAALQNAATSVKYDLTVLQVITSVQTVIATGNCSDLETLKNQLDTLNNQSCPL